jgi:hypothetical protein
MLRTPKSNMPLHKALKLSYLDDNKKKKKLLKKYGFRLDEDLSSHNQTVAYNPGSQRMLYSVAGTHNMDDIKTDFQLAFGNLKKTKRYQEAVNTLDRAKNKYKGSKENIISGESLGGTITSYLPYDDKTRAFAVNSGYTIGQQSRNRGGRLTNYRIKGDLISGLSAAHKFQNTLDINVPKKGLTREDEFFNEAFDRHTQKTKGTKIFI